MGFGNIGWFQILVILLIVLLVFGTKRIRNIGSDLGGAIREFRKGIGENDEDSGAGDKRNGDSGASASKDRDDSSDAKQGH